MLLTNVRKQRKIHIEYRVWVEDDFFIGVGPIAVRLICGNAVSIFRTFDLNAILYRNMDTLQTSLLIQEQEKRRNWRRTYRNKTTAYSAVAFYARDAFLKTWQNSWQVFS
jgi:hypothetical protein